MVSYWCVVVFLLTFSERYSRYNSNCAYFKTECSSSKMSVFVSIQISGFSNRKKSCLQARKSSSVSVGINQPYLDCRIFFLSRGLLNFACIFIFIFAQWLHNIIESFWNFVLKIFTAVQPQIWNVNVGKPFVIVLFSQTLGINTEFFLRKFFQSWWWYHLLVLNKGFCCLTVMIPPPPPFYHSLYFLRSLVSIFFSFDINVETFDSGPWYLIMIRSSRTSWIMVMFLFCESDLFKAWQNPTVLSVIKAGSFEIAPIITQGNVI